MAGVDSTGVYYLGKPSFFFKLLILKVNVFNSAYFILLFFYIKKEFLFRVYSSMIGTLVNNTVLQV